MEEQKRCTACGLTKTFSEFSFEKRAQRPASWCKKCCTRPERQKRKDANGPEVKCLACNQTSRYKQEKCNRCLKREGWCYCYNCKQNKIWPLSFHKRQTLCKECSAEKSGEYGKSEIGRKSAQASREKARSTPEGREKHREYFREYSKRDTYKKVQKRYGQSEHGRKAKNEYIKNRRKNDPHFDIKERCHRRIYRALKDSGIVKRTRTMELVGCSIPFLKQYIENQFKPGMSWELRNFHIDHIIPCAAFDLTDPEEQKRCFHYSNLQPLTEKENLEKNNKLPDGERAFRRDLLRQKLIKLLLTRTKP